MTTTIRLATVAALVAMLLLGGRPPGHAAEAVTARAERLPTLELNAADGFSIAEYTVRSGAYYRWRIESDGREDYELVSPELFVNSWLDRISVDDMQIRAAGLTALEFGEEGEIDVWFVPIRPGRYEFHVERLENQGFRGVFVVE